MKKIIITILFLFLVIPTATYSNNEVSSIAKNWFITFSAKISAKYTIDKEIVYFEAFSKKLDDLLITKKLNDSQVDLVNDLICLANEFVSRQNKYLRENSNLLSIKRHSLINSFKYKSFNEGHIFLENGVWYTYNFKSHLYFDEKNNSIDQATLDANNISKYSSIVFVREDGKFGFVTEYKKKKLISDSIIYGIPGRYNFLKEVRDDKKKLNYSTDSAFISLKNKAKTLTKGKTEAEKIKVLYEYVVGNVEYTENFSFDQAEVFSGIHTYARKDGVCEGYVKLFLYMLNFSNINHSEVIRGYVLDATDFPEVGHAWIKIGDTYYDPTFDDPLGQTKTREYSDYKYYSLPYDLFYTNRYTFENIPSFLKEKSLSYRKEFISKRVASLLYKYKNSGYNILKPFLLKYEYKINLNKELDLSDLKSIMGYYDVVNWKYIENGVNKNISNINYYTVNNSNTETVVSQLNYNLDGYHLFNWKLEDGNYEYRLVYELILN